MGIFVGEFESFHSWRMKNQYIKYGCIVEILQSNTIKLRKDTNTCNQQFIVDSVIMMNN